MISDRTMQSEIMIEAPTRDVGLSPDWNSNMALPDEFSELRLPDGVQARLEWLLDKQDRGERLSAEERAGSVRI